MSKSLARVSTSNVGIKNPDNSDPVLEFLSEFVSISEFLEVLSTDESVVEFVSTAAFDVHVFLIHLNSPDKTLTVWSCPSTYPLSSTSDYPDEFSRSRFFELTINSQPSSSNVTVLFCIPISCCLPCMMFSSKRFEESRIPVAKLLSCNPFCFFGAGVLMVSSVPSH